MPAQERPSPSTPRNGDSTRAGATLAQHPPQRRQHATLAHVAPDEHRLGAHGDIDHHAFGIADRYVELPHQRFVAVHGDAPFKRGAAPIQDGNHGRFVAHLLHDRFQVQQAHLVHVLRGEDAAIELVNDDDGVGRVLAAGGAVAARHRRSFALQSTLDCHGNAFRNG